MRDGLPTTEVIDLGDMEATVALDGGPRILGYVRRGGPELFARLPGEVIEHPSVGTFAFLGGHRLWRAPEIPAVTYEPDDRPVVIDRFESGCRLTGAPDRDGVVKVIALRQLGKRTAVDHTLRNEGIRTLRLAPWAITMMVPGGTAVLPQSSKPTDPDGVLPNRSVALWPYTDPSEAQFRQDEIRIHASRRPTRTKLGQPNRRGWLAYVLGDDVFVKWSPLHEDTLEYPDLGSSVECYRDSRFLELESLGPLVSLEPSQAVHHREVWSLMSLDGATPDDVLDSLPAEPPEMET